MEVCTLKIIIITIIIINRNHTSRLSYWRKWRHIIFLCQKKVSTWNWGRAENSYCIYPVFNVRVILFLSLCSDLESETGDDSKISSDDEIASVHDEEQSKDTNDVSAEGCSELAKRKPMTTSRNKYFESTSAASLYCDKISCLCNQCGFPGKLVWEYGYHR